MPHRLVIEGSPCHVGEMVDSTIPKLLTEAEAAALLRISPRTLRNLRGKGAIVHVKPSTRTVRYREDDLAEYIAKQSRKERPALLSPPHPKPVARTASRQLIGITEIMAARRSKN